MDLPLLAEALRGRRVLVLAGAGCSTESGIPDYRGTEGRRGRPPIQYQEFVRSVEGRTRYWARSAVGWPRFSRAQPNGGHRALARMEDAGIVGGVITQNVDGLHHAAGSRKVLELHGSLAFARCLQCGEREPRHELQARIVATNPGWVERAANAAAAPDGDADVPVELLDAFHAPACHVCDGILKPDVVLFGENVPRERVEEGWRMLEAADALLVVGSSLTVYSGRRFVDRAVQEGKPVAVVNRGPTRADDVACVRIDARLGEVLPRLADDLAKVTLRQP